MIRMRVRFTADALSGPRVTCPKLSNFAFSGSRVVATASKNTEQIAQSLSTSVPGYEIYSKHNEYLDYEATLLKQAQYVTVKIAILRSPHDAGR